MPLKTPTIPTKRPGFAAALSAAAIWAAAAVLALAAGAPVPSQPFAAGAPDLTAAGHWEGTIDIPGTPLPVRLDLGLSGAVGGVWNGTIDFPTQGAKGLPLEGVAVTGARVRFTVHGVPGAPTFDGTVAAGALAGTFTQGVTSFSFHLHRAPAGAIPAAAAAPPHPQEPKPPYPYLQREARYANGSIRLAGTLTLPPGGGPFPAVLLITGSGAQNRDEEILGHKPFLVLADHLTRAGIAVLRVDDRGVGGSSGDNDSSTDDDFAGDALAGVRYLAAQPEIARGHIGLLGHSEGGIVAPLAATRSSAVAFLVLLAATGQPGAEIVMSQTEWLLRQAHAPADMLRRRLDLEQRILDLVRTEADAAALRAKLRPLLQEGLDSSSPVERAALGGAADTFVEKSAQKLTSAWFRSFIRYDPRPTLRHVDVPVLALGGDKDFQVPAARNLQAIASALREAGDGDVTVRLMPGLNHLFQHAVTGGMEEYGASAETLSPEVLDIITRWILDRFAGKPAAP
jgi:pimeloyl-ACP methyl ester carboxylesterase